MRDDVQRALALDPSLPAAVRTIDITTTGRRSGERRRIETVFHRVADEIYLSGIPRPQPRAWLLNLEAEPRLSFHLKHGVQADLEATATVITDPAERRRVLAPIVDAFLASWDPQSPFPRSELDEWVSDSPLARLRFDD